MKKILSSPDPGEIAILRNMLETAGIPCLMRNEITAGLAPEVPLSESTPELWIQEDQQLAKALKIKKMWQTAPPVTGNSWVCAACGETSGPQFTSCWKCGAARA